MSKYIPLDYQVAMAAGLLKGLSRVRDEIPDLIRSLIERDDVRLAWRLHCALELLDEIEASHQQDRGE